jgi:hypothetical protein
MKPSVYKGRHGHWFVNGRPVGFLKLEPGFFTWEDALAFALKPQRWWEKFI